MSKIIIYQTPDNQTAVEVQMDKETVWLSLNQMSELFQRDKSVVSRHLKNIFEEGELEKGSVVAFFATTAADGKTYQVEYFNLDVIISVGYRVKSQRGTQFRIWASQILKNYLLQGYALNEKKLREQQTRLTELEKTLALIQESVTFDELRLQEARGMLEIIARYARTMVLLNQFDTGELANDPLNQNVTFEIQYPEAREVIDLLKADLIEKRKPPTSSATSATKVFGASSAASCRLSAANISTPASRSRRRTSCILSSKTTRSAMATNASAHCFSSGFWSGTDTCTASEKSTKTPSSPSPCSSRRATRRKKKSWSNWSST